MKKLVGMILVSILAVLLGGTCLAAPAFTDTPQSEATAATPDDPVNLADDVPVYGYVGRANAGGVDVDGDGVIDIEVKSSDILDMTVPLKIPLVAAPYGSAAKIYAAPAVRVYNNNEDTGTSVKVSIVGFDARNGTHGITLAAGPSDDNSIALQAIRPEGQRAPFDFPDGAGYVCNASEASPIVLGEVPGLEDRCFTYGSELPAGFLTQHMGQKLEYLNTFRFDKA